MNYERSVLPGGVRLLTESMPGAVSASLGFWINVGSRDESVEHQGTSHFLEHLLFKGTEHVNAKQIADAFDSVGGEANAFSSKEYTCVYSRVLAADLPMALDLLKDMIKSPAFRPDELDGERNVILEEIAMHHDTPEDLVHDVFAEAIFNGHPLGREVMGTPETIAAITRESLQEFHGGHYRAPSTVVSAAGAIDHEWLSEQLVDVLPAEIPDVGERTTPTPGKGSRVVRKDSEQAHIVIGGPGYERAHPDRFVWAILDNILGGGMSSRLFQEIREKRGLAYSVYSYRNSYSEAGLWAVYAGTLPIHAGEVLKIINDELLTLLESGPSEEEIVRAKGHLKGSALLALEEAGARMSRLGKGELLFGEVQSIAEIVERIEAVTQEQVGSLAKTLFDPAGRLLTVIGPFTEDDLTTWGVAG